MQAPPGRSLLYNPRSMRLSEYSLFLGVLVAMIAPWALMAPGDFGEFILRAWLLVSLMAVLPLGQSRVITPWVRLPLGVTVFTVTAIGKMNLAVLHGLEGPTDLSKWPWVPALVYVFVSFFAALFIANRRQTRRMALESRESESAV
ncbi:conserved hypothetical protein (plasmid) [Thioalkalivibrio sp. K90mix]|uniref:hypothetical protein n=1 Tax=Thioalkalivibrio sp. (strain K90mix) TaxID=396595 RepID=UPI000195A3C6|nr:hypothetical protein [Thioalkalivibrio sp. K90mix]ADC73168.1 conserved hypothetical protein [Thioalkalivibrio sp. K90mix]